MFHFYFSVLPSALTDVHFSNKFRKKGKKIIGFFSPTHLLQAKHFFSSIAWTTAPSWTAEKLLSYCQ